MGKIKPFFYVLMIFFLVVSIFAGYWKKDWEIPKNTAIVTSVLYLSTIVFLKGKRL
jgi:uncharacterized membrane protein AbrB (regulator of aidB expression)